MNRFLLFLTFVMLGLTLSSGMEILVTSICISGHLSPLIEPMKEMVSRGHTVTLLLYGNCESWARPHLGEFHENITIHQSAIDFENLSVDPHDEPGDSLNQFGDRYEKTLPQTYQTAIDFFADHEKTKYDVIFCDPYSLGSMMVAEQKRIPLVVNNVLLPRITSEFYGYSSWDFATIKEALTFIFDLRAICKPGTEKVMQIRENLVSQGSYLTPFDYHLGFAIVTQGGAPFWENEPDTERYKKVGFKTGHFPIQNIALKRWIEKSLKPVIYVSMGALTHIDYDEVKSIIEHAKNYKYRFVLSLNLMEIKQFREGQSEGYTDENVFIGSNLNQSALLGESRVKIAVSHCGPFSFLQSVYFGVPIICRPGYMDQFYISRIVEEEQLGVTITTALLFKDLHEAIEKLELNQAQIGENLKKYGKELEKNGGAEEIVNFIEKVARDKVVYKPFTDRIWPPLYYLFFTQMPLVVAIVCGVLFISVNVMLLCIFSWCSKSKDKQVVGHSKSKTQ